MDGSTAFLALKTANCAPLPDSSRFCRHSWRAWQWSLINSSWCMYLTCDNACGVFDFVLPEVFCPWDCRFAGLEPTRSFPAGEQRIKTKKRSMPLRFFHSRGVPAPSNLRKIRLRLNPMNQLPLQNVLCPRGWHRRVPPVSQQWAKLRSTNSPRRRSGLLPYGPALALDSGTPPVAARLCPASAATLFVSSLEYKYALRNPSSAPALRRWDSLDRLSTLGLSAGSPRVLLLFRSS